jgi:release factor glutamine methyltransferase
MTGMPNERDRTLLARELAGAGFVAAEDEADALIACAVGDPVRLDSLVDRRLTGEPLAWITGSVQFCGAKIRVDPGVYVPRWQSEPLARRAAARLPPDGTAIDMCTGAGAIATVLAMAHPRAQIVASDRDERAVACAVSNGVDAYCGDLFSPIPPMLEGQADVVVGVVPYVPTADLTLLAHGTLEFESPLAYDGGHDGLQILRRVLVECPRFLRPGGALLLELGGDQADMLGDDLAELGYLDMAVLRDEDDDVRGIEVTRGNQY